MNFAHRRYTYILLVSSMALLAIALRIHNAFHFNPYWGYDGGAHLAYIETLAREGRLPTMQESYVAWHEPLYYAFMAWWWRVVSPWSHTATNILDTLSFVQAMLGMLLVVLSYAWARIAAPDNRFTHLMALVFAATLPGSLLLSSYLTNELLLQIGMLGLLVLLVLFGFHKKRLYHIFFAVLLGFFSGCLLLTKLTALVPVGALVLWFLWGSLRTHSFLLFRNGILIALIATTMAIPWHIYRRHTFGTPWTINNYEQQLHARESRPLPKNFFTTFDTNIFLHPFWDTGATSFFTMLYADTFADYQGIFHNPDTVQLLPEHDRMEIANKQSIPKRQAAYLRYMLLAALPLAFAYMLGLIRLSLHVLRTRFKFTKELLVLLVCGGLFVALLYNVTRYPFLERGTLKMIFILALMPILAPYAFSFSRNMFYRVILGSATLTYAVLATLAFWV